MSPTHNNITYKNKKIKNKFDVTEENNCNTDKQFIVYQFYWSILHQALFKSKGITMYDCICIKKN